MGKAQLGEFEELVLLSILTLEDGAYTVSIQQQIEEKAGRKATLGSIYTVLSRLHEKGLVTSEMGESQPQRGGKRKRFYRILPAGVEALHEARRIRNRFWDEAPSQPAWQSS